jgi:hypothetical protein
MPVIVIASTGDQIGTLSSAAAGLSIVKHFSMV